MKNAALVPIVAIAAILVMEIYALSQGIDGKVLTFSVASCTAIGGWAFGRKIKNPDQPKP